VLVTEADRCRIGCDHDRQRAVHHRSVEDLAQRVSAPAPERAARSARARVSCTRCELDDRFGQRDRNRNARGHARPELTDSIVAPAEHPTIIEQRARESLAQHSRAHRPGQRHRQRRGTVGERAVTQLARVVVAPTRKHACAVDCAGGREPACDRAKRTTRCPARIDSIDRIEIQATTCGRQPQYDRHPAHSLDDTTAPDLLASLPCRRGNRRRPFANRVERLFDFLDLDVDDEAIERGFR
jgi:hypothetical protein